MSELRQVVLDTETTGLNPEHDRIVEIGCVEMINRRLTAVNFHEYLNPQMSMPQGAFDIHGLSDEFLADKALFAEVCHNFLGYIKGKQLVIHNASFDIGFLNAEMNRLDPSLGRIEDYCEVIDSLATARELHPGQRNDLDSLAKRYSIDNSHRTLHGALLDSEILAEVYLLMTGGQSALSLDEQVSVDSNAINRVSVDVSGLVLPVVKANEEELSAHTAMLAEIEKASKTSSIWQKITQMMRQDEKLANNGEIDG